mgnify:CR=1 FL=1
MAAKTKVVYRKSKEKRKHYRRKMTIPLAIVAGFASPVVRTIQHGRDFGVTGPEGAVAEGTRIMLGFNPYSTPMKFEAFRLNYGLYPVIGGLLVHKLAGMLGINRMLARSGIPLIRI